MSFNFDKIIYYKALNLFKITNSDWNGYQPYTQHNINDQN